MESKHPPADMTANRPPAEKANRLPAQKADRSLAEQGGPMINASYLLGLDVQVRTSGTRADRSPAEEVKRPSADIDTEELLGFVLRDDDALKKCKERDIENRMWRRPHKFKYFEYIMNSLYEPESNPKVSKPRSEPICALPPPFLHSLTSSMAFWGYPCYFRARLDAPGITDDEVYYKFLHDNRSNLDKLVVYWKRPTPHQSTDPCQFIDEEIKYGAYCRIISFPEAIGISRATIILKDGVLHIFVMKYPYALSLPDHSCRPTQCLRCILMK